MKKENNFSKWLDHNHTDDELKVLQQDSTFNHYLRISDAAQYFKAPNLDLPHSFDSLLEKREKKKKSKSALKYFISATAAMLVIAVGLYFALFQNTNYVEVAALKGETTNLTLPDASKVYLNAGSSVSHNNSNWDENRNINLKGEAYFEVAKGKTFTVTTEQGTVQVLGTKFNIKDREHIFLVDCFEGKVKVTFNNNEYIITKGESVAIVNNQLQQRSFASSVPDWMQEKSIFNSASIFDVLAEVERQYNVDISSENIPKNLTFTGSFTHRDLDTALKTVTLPFNLSYSVKGNSVSIYK